MSVTVSVIIASYNHEDYITRTLRSLEAQTFQDFEIIMVDDGSTDGTVQAARSVNSRAQIIVQENQGVDAARNRGIELSQGKYICFVDSDDMELPDRFERQAAVMEKDLEIGLVYADALVVDTQDKVLGKLSDVYPAVPGDVAQKLVTHYCFVPFATVMVRKETFLKTGLFDPSRQAMGHMKWIEIALISKTHYDPKPLACRRRHPFNTSQTTKKTEWYRRTRIALAKLLEKHPQLRAAVGKKAINHRFAHLDLLSGFYSAAEGDIRQARHYYYQAVRENPASLTNWGGAVLVSLPTKKLITSLHNYVLAKKIPW